MPDPENITGSFSSWLLKGFLPVAGIYVPVAVFIYLHWPLFQTAGAVGIVIFVLLAAVVLAFGLLLLSIAYGMFHPKPRIVVTRSEIAQEAIDGVSAAYLEIKELHRSLLSSVEDRLTEALRDVKASEEFTRGMQTDIMTGLLDKSAEVGKWRDDVQKQVEAIEQRFMTLSHKEIIERRAEGVKIKAQELSLNGAPDPSPEFWSAWHTREAVWRSELAEWEQIGRFYVNSLDEKLEANLGQGVISGGWLIPADAFPSITNAIEYRHFRIRYRNFEEAKKVVDANMRVAAYGH